MQFQRKALHTMLPCKQHFTLESKRTSIRDLVLPAVSLGTGIKNVSDTHHTQHPPISYSSPCGHEEN